MQAMFDMFKHVMNMNAASSSDDHYLGRQERKLTQKLASRRPLILYGEKSFEAWQESIITDATLMAAQSIFEGEHELPQYLSSLDKKLWSIKYELLSDRILSSLSLNISQEVRDFVGDGSFILFQKIIHRFQSSRAQTRLQLLQNLISIRADDTNCLSHSARIGTSFGNYRSYLTLYH